MFSSLRSQLSGGQVGLIIFSSAVIAMTGSAVWGLAHRTSTTTPGTAAVSLTGPAASCSEPPVGLSAGFFFNPATVSAGVGQTVRLTLCAATGTSSANAVDARIAYPAAQLTYLGFDGSASAFNVPAEASDKDGVITIARGKIGEVNGGAVVGVVVMRVKSGAASTPVIVSPDSNLLSADGQGRNLAAGSTAATTLVSAQ